MTPILYAKWGGIAALALALVLGGYHFGGLSADDKLNAYKTAVEAQHAAQLQAVVATMDEHDHQAALERIANQKVIDAYDLQKTLPPATAGIVQRMRLVEATACTNDRQLPTGTAVAGGTQAAGGIPRSDPEGDRLLQAALDAADRDAERLNAVVKLAP